MRITLLLALLLCGCGDELKDDDTGPAEQCEPSAEIPYDSVDQDCDGADLTDVDGDSYDSAEVSGGTDCDDADAAVHPGATESCSGVDDDCDGLVDDDDPSVTGREMWYADSDGDGYGDSEDSQPACEQPSGRVEDDSDCDDGDAAVNPDAEEVCDSIDNDCDGLSDDEDDGVTGREMWYADDDGDGYGDAADYSPGCEAPSGYVADDSDCDDSSAEVNPAATESCSGVDDDCDGLVDDEDDSVTGRSMWYADEDGDGYGDPDDYGPACEQPSGRVVDDSDGDDSDADVNPGATESCSGVDDDCDGLVDDDDSSVTGRDMWYADSDGDGYGDAADHSPGCEAPSGYVADDSDCDDGDAEVHPAATESCSGVDDNCDGLVDDDDSGVTGVHTWYADSDGDGYGDEDSTWESCTRPSGYASNPSDCDHSDAAVNPAAAETCNSVDDDCDGLVDDDDSSVTGRSMWYADDDGDGYGDAADHSPACTQPSGFVADSSDCDDTDGDAYPGADDDWYDGVDSDCDGASDYDQDGDGYDHDAYSGDDCDDEDGAISPGAAEVCDDGVDNDCDGTGEGCGIEGENDLSTVDDVIGYVEDWYGMSVSGGGDFDGDGYDDVIIGHPYDQSGGSIFGEAYVGYGCAVPGDSSCQGAYGLHTYTNGSLAGWSVAMIGDLDDDGYDDIAVGSPGESTMGSSAGAAYVVLGWNSTGGGSMTLTSGSDVSLLGDSSGDLAGSAVAAAGDPNGDGYQDLLVGSPDESTGGSSAGAAYLTSGPLTGSHTLSSSTAVLFGVAASDAAGHALAGVGDTDGDGLDDVLVGAYGADDSGSSAGAAYLLLGPVSGDLWLDEADAILLGEAAGDLAGRAVGGGGDVDGDGASDVLIGAPMEDTGGNSAGAAYLLLGPVSGSISLASSDAKLTGEAADDWAGLSVAIAGDVSGDGSDDLLIGAPYEDANGSAAGAAYLVRGPVTGTVGLASAAAKMLGTTTNMQAGYSVSRAGDYDGDTYDDILIGSPRPYWSGGAYVLLGGGM